MEDKIIEESDKPTAPLRYLQRLKKPAIFGVLSLLILTMNLYFSLTLPFLTDEIVKNRKQRAIIGGVLAGTLPFVGAVTSLIAGSVASKTTVKMMVGWSGVALFLTSIVFVIPMFNNALFDVSVVICRAIQGAALGLAEPMVVAVMGSIYKDSLGMVTAIYELTFSASLALGPFMGGFLYDVGGFYLPFVVTGSLHLIMSIIAIIAITKSAKERSEEDTTLTNANETTSRMKSLLRLPILLLGIVVMSFVAADEAFIGNFLAVYMKDSYQKTVEVTGTILMVCGVCYSFAIMLFGYLTDRGLSRAVTTLLGFIVLIIGTLLIDVSLFGAVWPSYVYPGIMFGLVEVGSAMIQVCILPLLVFHDGQPDQERSTEAMTGVYNAGFFIGAFIGPLVGSALVDLLSFPKTFIIFAAVMFAVFVIIEIANLKMKNLLNMKGNLIIEPYSDYAYRTL
ncbi:MFS-type transporter SLC18B1-like [Bolinopsis microptera]|uniref:MFS-type transporter SLC18B1-like n=1 Tax=Bolinopsis microptera TaxID=2820187 RepID=UPI0030793284